MTFTELVFLLSPRFRKITLATHPPIPMEDSARTCTSEEGRGINLQKIKTRSGTRKLFAKFLSITSATPCHGAPSGIPHSRVLHFDIDQIRHLTIDPHNLDKSRKYRPSLPFPIRIRYLPDAGRRECTSFSPEIVIPCRDKM